MYARMIITAHDNIVILKIADKHLRRNIRAHLNKLGYPPERVVLSGGYDRLLAYKRLP